MIELNKLSGDVMEFRNGREALDFFSSHCNDNCAIPDVIFLDINMPVMNGWDFIDEFRKIRPMISKDIMLYIVSSSADETDMIRARSLVLVDDYLTKPIAPSRLKSIFSTVAE